ncbi:MAG: M50 family metallopeptidase [Bacteroidales bacterium]
MHYIVRKVRAIGIIAAGAVALLYLYTFLHEGGHALVAMLYGGSIEKFALGLDAHVRTSGAAFTPFGAALFQAAGAFLPLMILVIALAMYKNDHKSTHYHFFYGLFSLGIIGSMLAWIVIPVVALFSEPPAGDDVTKFLRTTGIHPLAVTLVIAVLLAVILFWIVKLRIPQRLKAHHKLISDQARIRDDRSATGKNPGNTETNSNIETKVNTEVHSNTGANGNTRAYGHTGTSQMAANDNGKITSSVAKDHRNPAKKGWRFSTLRTGVITGVILLAAMAGVYTFWQPTNLLNVQVSFQVDESRKTEVFPFEVSKSGTYHALMKLTAEGIITDVQILNESNERIHQSLAQSFTMDITLDLDPGSYKLVLTLLKDQDEMRSHFRAMDYNFPRETLNELNAIIESSDLQTPENFEFFARIR